MENMNNKILRAVGRILLIICIICLVVVVGARIYFRGSSFDYYKASRKAFVIPELNKGFVAQGLCYDDKAKDFLVAGYKLDGASPIYVVDSTRNVLKRVSLSNNDGSEFVNHSGGIAIHNDYIYLAGCDDKCLYVFKRSDIYEAENDDKVKCLGIVDFKLSDDDYLRADCLTTDEEGIYVTEFYREENYKTAPSHAVHTIGDDDNNALVVKFNFDDSSNSVYGISTKPVLAMSIPDLTQGIAISSNKVYLSRSYGASSSSIDVYNLDRADSNKTIEVLSTNVKMLELDSLSMVAQKTIPPMSEEIVIVGDEMYTMCESASDKYIFGKLTSAEYCYATKMEFFKK